MGLDSLSGNLLTQKDCPTPPLEVMKMHNLMTLAEAPSYSFVVTINRYN